jgi:hypothetical protein
MAQQGDNADALVARVVKLYGEGKYAEGFAREGSARRGSSCHPHLESQ